MVFDARSAWVMRPHPKEGAERRLLCFPYAGGGVATYRSWAQELPDSVEVWAIQLPGRDKRRSEPPFERLGPLVRALADEVAPPPAPPFALFGHSMGALVAFEFARELRRRGAALPFHLIVSGRPAPHILAREPSGHLMTDAQLIDRLRADNGTPESVLQEPEFVSLFLPIIRADFAVSEAECFVAEEPLSCPISAFGGLSDPRATAAEIDAWREHTSAAFSRELFPGGHFFLDSARGALLRAVADRLRARDAT